MKRWLTIMLLALSISQITQAQPAPDDAGPELNQEYLSLVMRHLYRWYIDETALITVDNSSEVEFLLRWLKPSLDTDDQSRFIEMLVPQLSYRVVLKKADYKVPEMDADIQNANYRIIKAEKYDEPAGDVDSYRRVVLPKQEILDYLFKMRSVREYPSDELIERMRDALRAQYALQPGETVTGPQTVYVAPISEVSNNLWVFWENGGKIIRFSSDSDLTSRAFWDYEKLGVRVYDLNKDVVVSLAEAAGSNAFVTRDWAARVLFNCVVFGKRMVILPKEPAEESAESPSN